MPGLIYLSQSGTLGLWKGLLMGQGLGGTSRTGQGGEQCQHHQQSGWAECEHSSEADEWEGGGGWGGECRGEGEGRQSGRWGGKRPASPRSPPHPYPPSISNTSHPPPSLTHPHLPTPSCLPLLHRNARTLARARPTPLTLHLLSPSPPPSRTSHLTWTWRRGGMRGRHGGWLVGVGRVGGWRWWRWGGARLGRGWGGWGGWSGGGR